MPDTPYHAFEDCLHAGHPVFPGHFPGHPLIPGAMLVQRAIAFAETAFPGLEVCGVSRVKFRRPVGPDERFTVRIWPPGPRGVRFAISVGDDTASEGLLQVKEAAAA